jgi:3-hydroxyisobutyrate dehydrogenase
MKLVVNSALGAAIVGLGEAIALGDALGLDRGSVLDVLEASSLGAAARSKRESVETGSYPPRFKLGLALKDLGLVTEAAEAAGRELRLAEACRDWLRRAAEAGGADLDYSAVVATITGDPARG